jgi:hypothetical protein
LKSFSLKRSSDEFQLGALEEVNEKHGILAYPQTINEEG